MDLARLGIDGQALVEHPTEGHVRGADRVRAQHDLVERIARRDPDRDATDRAVVVGVDARACERAAHAAE